MRSRSLLIVALLGALLAVPATARAGYLALVPDATYNNGSNGYVAGFDTGTNARTDLFEAGNGMLGVAIAPDGRTGYIVGTATHTLTPVDLTKTPLAAGTPLALSGAPTYIAIAPDGRKAYISDGAYGADNKVIVTDLTGSAPAVAGTIDVGLKPHGIAFTPDGTRAFVANFGDGTVTPIDAATDTAGTPIGVGVHPDQIAITPDGSRAYVTDNGANAVYPIALPAGTVGAPITVGTGKEHPLGIAITPDGTKAYTANNGTEDATAYGNGVTVTPIALATNTAGTPIVVGDLASGPWAVGVTPDSKTAYVSSWRGTYPIDTATDVPADPIGLNVVGRSIAIAPDQGPEADFSVTSAPPGSATTFDASASTVGVGTIVSYDWDFGDGDSATTTTPTTSHIYANAGSYTAAVTETDSAGTSVDTFTYTGQTASRVGNPLARSTRTVHIATGPAPAVTLSAGKLDFGTIATGTHSVPQTLSLTNTGDGALEIAGSTLSGSTDFALADDTCSGRTVAAGASCSASVTFTPTASGPRQAVLAFADDASGSPHTVALTGAGFAPGTGTLPGFGTGTTTGAISGVVVDATVANAPPLPSSYVTVCTAGSSSGCLYSYTDGGGRFAFGSIPAGRYVVLADPPSKSTLSQGSRVVDVVAGVTADASMRLTRIAPLPQSMTFTSPSGGSSNGTPSTLRWDEAFQFSLPPLKAFGARGTPNTSVATSIVVSLSTPGDNRVVVGSVLGYEVAYDSAGKPKAATAKNTPLSGLVADGFTFEIGDLAVFPGASVSADPDALAAATRIVAKTGGLHSLAHGALLLTVVPVHDEAPIATLKAALPPAKAADACADARAAVLQLERELHEYQAVIAEDRYELEVGKLSAQEREDDVSFIKFADGHIARLQLDIDTQLDVANDVCTLPEPCVDDDNIFKTPGECIVTGKVAVDPSGFVVTREGVPVEKAKVVLLRSDTAVGPFTAPPNGDGVMTVANRKNPDSTDIDGHFGWDVFPGYYRVRATRTGCKGSALTKALPVPPPVTNLRLVLNCPKLKRTATKTRVLKVRKSGPGSIVTLQVRAGAKAAIGLVNVSAGKARSFAFLDKRGRARVILPAHAGRVTVRYPGNARFSPSRS
jgi:YVTN family beta-propeller protein